MVRCVGHVVVRRVPYRLGSPPPPRRRQLEKTPRYRVAAGTKNGHCSTAGGPTRTPGGASCSPDAALPVCAAAWCVWVVVFTNVCLVQVGWVHSCTFGHLSLFRFRPRTLFQKCLPPCSRWGISVAPCVARVAAGTLIYVWLPPGSSSPRCGDVRKLLQGSSWRYRVATAAAGPAAGRRRGGPGPPGWARSMRRGKHCRLRCAGRPLEASPAAWALFCLAPTATATL